MSDMLQQAAAWLDGMRQAHLSRTVEYSRGELSVELPATLGSTTYEVMDESGATVQAKATDFIVSADALVVGGETVKPEPGDRINVPAGEKLLVFEVLDLGGAGHYRPCDPGGRMLRIHAKQVGEEQA
jgi:hypothetical protein